jgi:hypothetical protein
MVQLKLFNNVIVLHIITIKNKHMKRYFKNFDTFICFDESEKLITTVTSHTTIDGKSMVYTKDERGFESVLHPFICSRFPPTTNNPKPKTT